MRIRISYFHRYSEKQNCYELNTKVNCEEAEVKPASTIIAVVAIIFLTVVVVAVIVFMKQRVNGNREKPKEQNELNDLYGTYYHGVEYNIANDNNQRYNEDGGDAVVTDANAEYYQLASATDHKRKHNQNGGKNGATSPNGNRYYKL